MKAQSNFSDSPDLYGLRALKTDLPKIDPYGAGGDWSFDLSVDGVEIGNLNAADPNTMANTLDALEAHFKKLQSPDSDLNFSMDVLIVCKASYDEATIRQLVRTIRPRIVIVHPSLMKIGDQEVTAVPHNTLAVSAATGNEKEGTRFVSLTDTPYEMPDELADLFSKKETASKNSRETFAKLSINQLNFRPSNGTHTPRWNTEHMMGRELLFFSQIYHAVDPSIRVMDLNPRQMPDDYEMAHPDWTGAEEARQTERVEAFTRRFAYVLDGMDLNAKAKGSKFWTPKALLKQMERHYNEHTANVRKKMELDEWPKQ